jgi:cation diffusion facilitator CzcD-associated flavoprotein CzcO
VSGIYGLSSAATYRRLHPQASVLIVEGSHSIGGTWAVDRLFPGLKTNNLLGMYEHPDLPMSESKLGVEKGKHIPGGKVLEYLEMFVQENGLNNQIRRGTKVEVVKKETDGWLLHCKSYSRDGTSYSKLEITAKKLVIAVGNTNKPKMPNYLTSPSFEPRVIHSKDFAVNYEDIVKPSKHTLVIGGGKSAFDVAYACATQTDATVTLLIRPSGNGPNWVAPTHVTPFKLWLEKLVFTRFFGCT